MSSKGAVPYVAESYRPPETPKVSPEERTRSEPHVALTAKDHQEVPLVCTCGKEVCCSSTKARHPNCDPRGGVSQVKCTALKLASPSHQRSCSKNAYCSCTVFWCGSGACTGESRRCYCRYAAGGRRTHSEPPSAGTSKDEMNANVRNYGWRRCYYCLPEQEQLQLEELREKRGRCALERQRRLEAKPHACATGTCGCGTCRGQKTLSHMLRCARSTETHHRLAVEQSNRRRSLCREVGVLQSANDAIRNALLDRGAQAAVATAQSSKRWEQRERPYIRRCKCCSDGGCCSCGCCLSLSAVPRGEKQSAERPCLPPTYVFSAELASRMTPVIKEVRSMPRDRQVGRGRTRDSAVTPRQDAEEAPVVTKAGPTASGCRTPTEIDSVAQCSPLSHGHHGATCECTTGTASKATEGLKVNHASISTTCPCAGKSPRNTRRPTTTPTTHSHVDPSGPVRPKLSEPSGRRRAAETYQRLRCYCRCRCPEEGGTRQRPHEADVKQEASDTAAAATGESDVSPTSPRTDEAGAKHLSAPVVADELQPSSPPQRQRQALFHCEYGRKVFITDDEFLERRRRVISRMQQAGSVQPLSPYSRSRSATLAEKADRWRTSTRSSSCRAPAEPTAPLATKATATIAEAQVAPDQECGNGRRDSYARGRSRPSRRCECSQMEGARCATPARGARHVEAAEGSVQPRHGCTCIPRRASGEGASLTVPKFKGRVPHGVGVLQIPQRGARASGIHRSRSTYDSSQTAACMIWAQ